MWAVVTKAVTAAQIAARLTGTMVEGVLTRPILGGKVFPRSAAEIAAAVVPTDLASPYGWLERYGTVGAGIAADDTAALAAAALVSATHAIRLPAVTLLINAKVTIPDRGRIYGMGRDTVIQKAASGYLFNLGRQAKVTDIRFDGARSSYTGGGIEITVGENTPTVANQGHQVIEDCYFENFDGYAIDYTVANRGWMSRINRCRFEDYNAPAAIRWPQDATAGGNRHVTHCSSINALVDVGGADNGVIAFNDVGNEALVASNAGLVFSAGGTRAKKLIITGNRFGLGVSTNTMNLRGIDCVFTGNMVAGSVVLESETLSDGATNWRYADNQLTGTFTDSSGVPNQVRLSKHVPFTPVWTTTGTAPAFGNADVRCVYTREGGEIRAKYFIKFGSTTTFGTGSYNFSVPVARLTGGTTDYVGSAFIKDRSAVSRTLFSVGSDAIALYASAAPVAATSPIAWASGDLFVIEISYRIF